MLGFHVCIAAGSVEDALDSQRLMDKHHMPYEGSKQELGLTGNGLTRNRNEYL